MIKSPLFFGLFFKFDYIRPLHYANAFGTCRPRPFSFSTSRTLDSKIKNLGFRLPFLHSVLCGASKRQPTRQVFLTLVLRHHYSSYYSVSFAELASSIIGKGLIKFAKSDTSQAVQPCRRV